MRRLDVSAEADLEAEDILAYSEKQFGSAAADRYRMLIQTAYRDLLSNPARPGVTTLPGVSNSIHLYPVRYSRVRLPRADRVSGPRHVIAFRYDEARIEIVHLLHDAMDLPARLR